MKDLIVRIDAAALADGTGFFAAPGSVLLRLPDPSSAEPTSQCPARLAAGPTGDVLKHPASADARVMSLPNSLLIPGLVNAHTHLDLTHIGPRPHDPSHGFVPWVDMIRRERRVEDAGIRAAVTRGIELSLAGGTVAVGDIAGAARGVPSLEPHRTLRDSPLAGVSYLEFFSRGKFREKGLAAGLDTLDAGLREEAERLIGRPASATSVRLGLQPHAPNTVELESFRRATAAAISRGVPLCTHLAESPEERRFISLGDGPQRQLLETLGVWDDAAGADVGRGQHPAEYLEHILLQAAESQPYLVAHVNDASDRTIDILARSRTRVAYCPRASAYFGAHRHFGPHRYRDMLDAGIPVALGTDSIVNLPDGADEPARGGISIFHEMQFLARRDGADPFLLLRMATLNGARALGLAVSHVAFGNRSSHLDDRESADSGDLLGLLAVTPEVPIDATKHPVLYMKFVLQTDVRLQLLFYKKTSRFTGTADPF